MNIDQFSKKEFWRLWYKMGLLRQLCPSGDGSELKPKQSLRITNRPTAGGGGGSDRHTARQKLCRDFASDCEVILFTAIWGKLHQHGAAGSRAAVTGQQVPLCVQLCPQLLPRRKQGGRGGGKGAEGVGGIGQGLACPWWGGRPIFICGCLWFTARGDGSQYRAQSMETDKKWQGE